MKKLHPCWRNNIRPIMLALLAIVGLTAGWAEESGSFSKVEIEAAFKPFLMANKLLMEVTGAKIIKLKDGRKMLLAVAATEVREDTAKDRLRRITVCKSKALAHIVREREGVQVATCSRFSDQTVVTIEDGIEKAKSVSESLEMTQSTTEGIARELPVIGTWYSADGQMFYLAVGGFLDQNNKLIREMNK